MPADFPTAKEAKKQTQQLRAELGLRPLRPAKRACMCCGKKFASADIGNRVCGRCKDHWHRQAGDVFHY